MKNKLIIALACFATAFAATAQQPSAEGYIFTDVKINPRNISKRPVAQRHLLGIPALGFVESEIMRAGGEEVALSPMWVVRNIYFEKAVRVRPSARRHELRRRR